MNSIINQPENLNASKKSEKTFYMTSMSENLKKSLTSLNDIKSYSRKKSDSSNTTWNYQIPTCKFREIIPFIDENSSRMSSYTANNYINNNNTTNNNININNIVVKENNDIVQKTWSLRNSPHLSIKNELIEIDETKSHEVIKKKLSNFYLSIIIKK
jgi:hypothetical protein